jgi:tRNA splicing endonuclease
VMTSKSKDWIDEVLDDEPCSAIQIGIIESLLITSSANINYKNLDIEKLTYEEAERIIRELRENNNSRDCKDQFNKMFEGGIFK